MYYALPQVRRGRFSVVCASSRRETHQWTIWPSPDEHDSDPPTDMHCRPILRIQPTSHQVTSSPAVHWPSSPTRHPALLVMSSPPASSSAFPADVGVVLLSCAVEHLLLGGPSGGCLPAALPLRSTSNLYIYSTIACCSVAVLRPYTDHGRWCGEK